jgi:flagellin
VTTPYATSKPGTGVFAKVNPNVETGQQMDDSTVVSGVVYVNGYASAQVTNVLDNPQATRANVVKAINEISDKTGVKAVDSGADDKGITLVAQDGRNIEVSFQTNANANVFGAAMGLNEGVQSSTISLESKIDAPIVLTNSPTGDISRVGLNQGDYTKNQSVLNTAPRAPVQALVPQQESVEISGTVASGLSSTVIVNGVNFTSDKTFTNPQDMRDNLISKINTDTTLGVYATAGSDGGQVILTARTPGVPFTMSASSSDTTNQMGVTTHEITPNTPPQFKALQTNDLKINGITIRQSVAADDTSSQSIANSSDPASSAIAVAAAINASSSQTGVTAQANPVVSVGSNTSTDVPASGKQSLYINGVQI